jgi:hypothetical protein
MAVEPVRAPDAYTPTLSPEPSTGMGCAVRHPIHVSMSDFLFATAAIDGSSFLLTVTHALPIPEHKLTKLSAGQKPIAVSGLSAYG